MGFFIGLHMRGLRPAFRRPAPARDSRTGKTRKNCLGWPPCWFEGFLMQVLKTIFWVVVAVALALFTKANWEAAALSFLAGWQ